MFFMCLPNIVIISLFAHNIPNIVLVSLFAHNIPNIVIVSWLPQNSAESPEINARVPPNPIGGPQPRGCHIKYRWPNICLPILYHHSLNYETSMRNGVDLS